MDDDGKVLLISMPFGALNRQALGISLLKAALLERGIPCQVRYLCFDFAEFASLDDYQWINFELPYTAFAGDWVFIQALYGDRPAQHADYVREVLQETWQLGAGAVRRLLRVRAVVEAFLEHCLRSVPWRDYAIVGFTSTFEQNIASLALAKRLKAAHPHLKIVFGGANWEAGMGLELHRQFPFVDYACSGEAEQSFLALVEAVLNHRLEGLPEIAGIVYRDGRSSVSTGQARLITDLDALPIPDYSDYFAQLERGRATAPITPSLLFETSRGCWWGAKSHCTFCGLNGTSLRFRSKSPARAMSELEHLRQMWGVETLEAVDNILDMRYFETWLPQLAQRESRAQLFFEIKANLSREQVRLLGQAGVHRVQPGIESLSDHVLELMGKGTTALRNVQLLKWAHEYGIQVDWNILYGFPGETATDYAQMLELLRAIRFLPAPAACGPIRLDRFSPYFDRSAEYGFERVRPMKPYRYLYPFEPGVLHRIAYYFEYEYSPKAHHAAAQNAYAREVIAFAEAWKRQPEPGCVRGLPLEDRLVLLDSRSDATCPHLELSGADRTIYEFCDSLHHLRAIMRHLKERHPNQRFETSGVQRYLASLVANRLMITDGTHFLSLALNVPPVDAASPHGAAARESRAARVTSAP